jgi:hypothetical protein
MNNYQRKQSKSIGSKSKAFGSVASRVRRNKLTKMGKLNQG